MTAADLRWEVLLPLKAMAASKSRLLLPPQDREALVLAMLMDVVSAVRQSPLVSALHVVTSDAATADRVVRRGIPLAPVSRTVGLNEELRLAAAGVGEGRGILVVLPDLAAVRPSTLGRVLALAPDDRPSFVPDLQEDGTTMLLTPPGSPCSPSFGAGSRKAHAGAAVTITGADARARLDVDDLSSLRRAIALGPGPAVQRWLHTSDRGAVLTPTAQA